MAQAGAALSGTDLLIAGQIIDGIDETGYFLGSALEISRRLDAPLADVERVLAIVQSFDRPGSAPGLCPSASPSRRGRRTATIRRWRG
jgi:RNA polymerase sigma-54 factor